MRPRHDTPPDLRSAAYMGHDLGAGFCLAFAINAQRAYFDAEPPALQRETIARVNRLIAERPGGYLARHWRAMYLDPGIVPPARLRVMLGVQ